MVKLGVLVGVQFVVRAGTENKDKTANQFVFGNQSINKPINHTDGPGVGAVSSYGQVTTSCGQSTQTQSCSSGPCCQWTGWQPWTACSATCGDGYKTRTQSCSCGTTGYGGINGGGSQCPGEVPAQQTNCNNAPCQTYVAPQVDAYQPQPPPQPTYQVPQPTYQPQPAVQQGYRLN